MRVGPLLVLLLLGAFPAWGQGSYNRLPSPPPEPAAAEAEAPPVAAPVAPASPTSPAAPDPVADPDAPQGAPTHGEVCIYGPSGVVYVPEGKDCGEAAPAPASASPQGGSGAGRCILGTAGQVVYAPPGVDCEGALREESAHDAPRRPRSRRLRY